MPSSIIEETGYDTCQCLGSGATPIAGKDTFGALSDVNSTAHLQTLIYFSVVPENANGPQDCARL